MCPAPVTLRRLTPTDVPLLRQLNAMFGETFAQPETYAAASPSDAYLESLLAKEHVVALVALAGEEVLGGLVAYELDKFERARREVYIYELAVRPVSSLTFDQSRGWSGRQSSSQFAAIPARSCDRARA